MVDTGTGLTVLAPSALMFKILGPTAEYLGDGVQQWTARRVENIHNVFEKAGEKLGDERLDNPGSVPPKVLKGVLEEASFCEDELAAEYLGGVLASSRSDQPRDDRAISLLALVSRMSTYQLRTHYVMYAGAQQVLVDDPSINLGIQSLRRERATFYLPGSVWTEAMEFSDEERQPERFQPIVDHVIYGLERDGLIDENRLTTGSRAYLEEQYSLEFPEEGFIFCLSMLGIELFAVANGVQGRPAVSFLERSEEFKAQDTLPLKGSLIPLSKLAEKTRET